MAFRAFDVTALMHNGFMPLMLATVFSLKAALAQGGFFVSATLVACDFPV